MVVGIDLTGFFIGIDPRLQDPALLPRSIPVPTEMVVEITRHGWHAWEQGWDTAPFGFAEVLVGGTGRHFVRYIEFERLAVGLDPGPRQLMAEKLAPGPPHWPGTRGVTA